MQETKVVIGIACFSSLLAIMATLVVMPQLYSQINDLNLRVRDGVQAFRVNTDSAWNDLMELQVAVTPQSKPRSNPFQSLYRQKRSLPDYCICQPLEINCMLDFL